MKRHWFKIFIGVYLILNGLFVGLEIKKDQLRGQWIQTTTIPESAFLELHQLNQWTSAIEFILIALVAGVGVVLLITKSQSLKLFVYSTLILSGIIFVTAIAIPLNITSFYIVQQLIGPVFLLVCLSVYLIIKNGLNKRMSTNKLAER